MQFVAKQSPYVETKDPSYKAYHHLLEKWYMNWLADALLQ
jgi:hypothetical protein